jgi:hypothetical protein
MSNNPLHSEQDGNSFDIQVEQMKENQISRLYENFKQGRLLKRIVQHPIGRRALLSGAVAGAFAVGIEVSPFIAGKTSSSEQTQKYVLDEKKLTEQGFRKFEVLSSSSDSAGLNMAELQPYAKEITLSNLSETVTPLDHSQVPINFISQRADDRDKTTNEPKGKLREGINIISFDPRQPDRTIPFAVSLPDNLQSDNLLLYMMRIGENQLVLDAFLEFSDLQMQADNGIMINPGTPITLPIKPIDPAKHPRLEGQVILIFGRKH